MSRAFLDRIPDPQTLRKFDLNQLCNLAKDLRQAIINSLAKGEGHLGKFGDRRIEYRLTLRF